MEEKFAEPGRGSGGVGFINQGRIVFTEIHWNEAEKAWQVQLFSAEGEPIGKPSYAGANYAFAEALGAAMLKGEAKAVLQ